MLASSPVETAVNADLAFSDPTAVEARNAEQI